MKNTSDILIVGGGLNGPALALALAQTGHSVTVVDALPRGGFEDEGFDGRGYALALASQRLLAQIGIWPQVAEQAQPMLEIKASDGHAGEGAAPFFVHFDHREIEEGPMGYMLEDRYLRRALLKALEEEPRISLINGARVVAQDTDQTGVTLTLASGDTLRGGILVGADGRKSGTAARAGIKRTGWDYGQTALVCAIDHEKPHHGIAHQFFMEPGPLAVLPLPGNRSSIVWSEKTEMAEAIQGLDDSDYITALKPRFGNFLGEISLAGKRFTYPLNLTIANSFTGARMALIGDAAHGMHPIAGQGLNAGLRDVGALAEVLTEARRRGEDAGSSLVLDRYQQWRRFDTATLVAGTDMVNKLFSNDNPLLRLGRDLGMGLVNSLPGLRRGFMREAAGLTGDLPRLLKGEAI